MNCLFIELQVTENLNPDPLLGLCQCPLCQLDCGSREQLIAHVYQVWGGDPKGLSPPLRLHSNP